MRIGEMNRDNYADFQNMVNKMKPKISGSGQEDTSMYRSKFEYRYKPIKMNFVKPNWDQVMTKRSQPAMSDEEFEEAIRELAREDSKPGAKRNIDKYNMLAQQYMEVVSPDRKALYDESMKITGGKMNAAKGFFNNAGQLLLTYNDVTGNWFQISTAEEGARGRQFHAIYVDEMKKIQAAGGANTSNFSIDTKA